jgi:hypothetical protein
MAGMARNGIDSSAPMLNVVKCGVLEIANRHEVDAGDVPAPAATPAKPPWPSYLRSAVTAMLHFHSTIPLSLCCFSVRLTFD